MRTPFPGLAKLCNYVSNAWDYQFGTPEAAVEAFIEDQSELRSSAAEGVSEVLTTCDDEQDRLHALGDLGWGYAPAGDGELDEFLVWTHAVLLEAAANT